MATLDGITIVGRYNTEQTMAVIGHRLRHVELAAPMIYRILETWYMHEFERGFGKWRGFLIDTGALEASLTVDDADHAIRERHKGIEFGSSLYYARFHARYLLHIPRWVDDLISETVADYLVPEERLGGPGVVSGYFARRGGQREPVFVRPYVRGPGFEDS